MKRVELYFEESDLQKLQELADKDKRSRKNFMELIIINYLKEQKERENEGKKKED
jgi:metal-responsive CopG/Arc/MetJ family transcriptional regulator